MKLWKLTPKSNTRRDPYNFYSSCIVAAENEEAASQIHPTTEHDWVDHARVWRNPGTLAWWVRSPAQVRTEYLGEARPGMPAGIILTSGVFN